MGKSPTTRSKTVAADASGQPTENVGAAPAAPTSAVPEGIACLPAATPPRKCRQPIGSGANGSENKAEEAATPRGIRNLMVMMPRVSPAAKQQMVCNGKAAAATATTTMTNEEGKELRRLGGERAHVEQLLSGIAAQSSQLNCDIVFICRLGYLPT